MMERALIACTGFAVGPAVIICAEGEVLPQEVNDNSVFAADHDLSPPDGSLGLWVFEGDVDSPGDEETTPTYRGDWRRPTVAELEALGEGLHPWESEVPL